MYVRSWVTDVYGDGASALGSQIRRGDIAYIDQDASQEGSRAAAQTIDPPSRGSPAIADIAGRYIQCFTPCFEEGVRAGEVKHHADAHILGPAAPPRSPIGVMS